MKNNNQLINELFYEAKTIFDEVLASKNNNVVASVDCYWYRFCADYC